MPSQDRPLAWVSVYRAARGQHGLLLVHAHPDDESIGTGATMAKYAAEGVPVTLVTCTLGELGEIIPAELAHLADGAGDRLGEYRRAELAAACTALRVSDHRFLGGPGRWRDSGMAGLPDNDAPECFWQADVAEAAADLAVVIREVRPRVLVTYDDNGFYGHPDHIQANRVTQAAVKESGIPAKLYYTALPRSALAGFRELLEETGIETPEEVEENPDFGTPDELVTTRIDVSAVTGLKYASLAAHASQSDNIFFLEMGEELFSRIMDAEFFVRAFDTTKAPVPEEDLFAGLR